MNTKTLIPLTAAALFAVCAGSMLVASHSLAANAVATTSTQATTQHIVDLPAVTVRPEASDMAAFLADNSARIVDMPVVTVRPTVEDIQIVAVGVAALAQQLASR